MVRDEYWTEISKKMGYESEKEMWDTEYKNSPQGLDDLSKKMKTFYCFAPTFPTLRRRLKELDYQIKPPGGKRMISKYRDKLVALGRKRCAAMTRLELMAYSGYTDANSFYTAMKHLGFEYIRDTRWRNKEVPENG